MQYKFIPSIHHIDAQSWDSLFAQSNGYPFVQHAFLATLENTDCTNKASGWQPHHLTVTNSSGQLVAALVLFLKNHSYGEYVFDWSWADAYAQNGLDYYPKFVSAIPFTPATGPRFGFAETLSAEEKNNLAKAMADHLQAFSQEKNISGVHILFPSAEQFNLPLNTTNNVEEPLENQWQQRIGCQYQWFNQGYSSFEQFLETFSSRKRKNVKKERAKVSQQNITLTMRSADAVPLEEWETFYALYHHTYLKRSGRYGYLTKAFFLSLAKIFPTQVLLCQAWRDQEMIAAALYFRDNTTLYGRYWGAMEELDGLHFEACYYQGIEYAIANGLQRFDPGAQGEHKIQRGFVPVKTSSLHWLAHPGFQHGVAQFLQNETQHMQGFMKEARELLPFREGIELPAEGCLLEGGDAES